MQKGDLYTNGLDNVIVETVEKNTITFWHNKQLYQLDKKSFKSEFSYYDLNAK